MLTFLSDCVIDSCGPPPAVAFLRHCFLASFGQCPGVPLSSCLRPLQFGVRRERLVTAGYILAYNKLGYLFTPCDRGATRVDAALDSASKYHDSQCHYHLDVDKYYIPKRAHHVRLLDSKPVYIGSILLQTAGW